MVEVLTPHQCSPDSPLRGDGVSLLLAGTWLPTWSALTSWVGAASSSASFDAPWQEDWDASSQPWRAGSLDSPLAFPGRGGAFTVVSGRSRLIIV